MKCRFAGFESIPECRGFEYIAVWLRQIVPAGVAAFQGTTTNDLIQGSRHRSRSAKDARLPAAVLRRRAGRPWTCARGRVPTMYRCAMHRATYPATEVTRPKSAGRPGTVDRK